MTLKLFLQLSAVLLVGAELTRCLGIQGSEPDENVKDILAKNPRLGYLGKVGNKSYFMDNSTTFTWNQARSYAAELNMNLANFSSQTEADFIMTMPVEKLPAAFYWTSGADRSDLQRFTWNPYLIEEGVAFEAFGFVVIPRPILINLCLVLHVHTSDFKDFHTSPKDESYTNYVLLQN